MPSSRSALSDSPPRRNGLSLSDKSPIDLVDWLAPEAARAALPSRFQVPFGQSEGVELEGAGAVGHFLYTCSFSVGRT